MTALGRWAKSRQAAWVRRIFTVLLYALMAVGVQRYLRGTDWDRLRRISLDLPLFGFAVLFGVASRFMLPFGWMMVLRRLHAGELPMRAAVLAYAHSWLGRYLPGKALMIVARVTVASRYGISASVVALTSIFELVVQMAVSLAAGLIGILTFRGALPLVSRYAGFLVLLVPVLCALVSPPVLNGLVARRCRKAGLPPPRARVDLGVVAAMVGLCLTYSFCFALYSGWMMAAVTEGVFARWWFLWGALNFARIAGMAVLMAPAGLGVREAVLVLLLSLYLPKEAVLSGVLVMRAGDMLADLLFVAVASLVARRRVPAATA